MLEAWDRTLTSLEGECMIMPQVGPRRLVHLR